MYLIKDKDLVKSLVEKAKVKDLNNKKKIVDASIYENIEPCMCLRVFLFVWRDRAQLWQGVPASCLLNHRSLF